MNKSLFAGPFVGEFGHELFCWQGVLRSIAPNYSGVTIVCGPGKEVLYEDFAEEILIYRSQEYIPTGSFNRGVTKNYPLPSTGFLNANKDWDLGRYLGPNCRLTDYKKKNGSYAFFPRRPEYAKQKFIKLGSPSGACGYDYIVHARGANRKNPSCPAHPHEKAALKAQSKRNWAIEKWEQLAGALSGKKACIGTLEASYYIEGTVDLRGMDLRNLCDILSSSGMIIGPSSGPLHLAALCGLPQVVWSNKKRYEKDWNPYNTPTFYLDKSTWNPSPQDILSAIHSFSHELVVK